GKRVYPLAPRPSALTTTALCWCSSVSPACSANGGRRQTRLPAGTETFRLDYYSALLVLQRLSSLFG
ncbi:hypothetical protein G7B13_29910, partial [Klebsiella pneumoniae]|nr:hypothetical protein [Klebsiella pneumoniae]